MSEAGNILEVRNLSIGFGDQPNVVDQVSFSLRRGQTIGLIGRSGSGKSMIAHAIAGLLPPAARVRSGSIAWREAETREINTLPEKELRKLRGRKIGMIFQEPQSALNPTMRCGRQFAEALQQYFPACSKMERDQEMLSWLEKVRLPDPERMLRAYPHELSGGQQQRLLIAMAMSAEPALLIADEPTTALDTVTELEILQLLKKLTSQHGSALLFISHDLAVVRYLAEETLVLEAGKSVAAGHTSTLIDQPPNAIVKALVEGSARLNHGKDALAVAEHTLEEGMSLEVDALSFDYVVKRNFLGKASAMMLALDQVSFQLRKGEFLALVGESGCGKTTLGKCLNGLLTGYRGKILSTSAHKYAIQTVFQDPVATLNPSFSAGQTVGEVIGFMHPELSKTDLQARTTALFEQVGLPYAQFTHRYPEELSGGQRQRIAIARALAAEPDVLICDEAVSALDAGLQTGIMDLIASLRQHHGLSVIFISHDLALVMRYADRIIVMHKGRIVETGTPAELLHTAKNEQTRQLVKAALL